jgi:hypothetical protein
MITLPKRHTSSPLGHSADVSLWLHVAGQKLSLAQTSSTAIKLVQDKEILPGPAKIEIINDGVSHWSDVTIAGREPNSHWLNIE